MGNYKLKLSDMIPNAWFYKLKNPTKISQKTQISQPKFAYHFSKSDKIFPLPKHPKPSISHFPDPPRKSSKKINAGCSCDSVVNSGRFKSGSTQSNRVSFSSSANSAGIKLRSTFPKIGERCQKKSKSVDKSFAIVKFSIDPQKDFRESMAEMIVENNIWELQELEELLACYLSLNSKDYHHYIVMAFEQIWAYL